MVLPETAFGIFSALSGPLLTTNRNPEMMDVLARLPKVILWVWANVLLFDIANQRLPASILEDSINKPWRALPSHRITEQQARRLLLAVVPTVFLLSFWLGGGPETVLIMVLTWMYNDLGGADEVYVIRNFINGLGFVCYGSGAATVASGLGTYSKTWDAYVWAAMVGGIVFTTVSAQDLPDIAGDALRGRLTAPLVHGDVAARWSISTPIMVWSFICPWFWGLGWFGYATSVGMGATLALRIIHLRRIDSDRLSWKMWCFWIVMIYALPLLKLNGM